MRSDPECVPCLLKRVLFQSRLVEGEDGQRPVQAALREMAEAYDGSMNSAKMASRVHRRAYQELGVDDPYQELKERSDAVALELLPQLEAMLESAEDRLETAVVGSIAGNVMDFGAGIALEHPDELRGAFLSLMEQGLDVSDLDVLESKLAEGGTVLYLFDNCGESVFDRLLIKEIWSRGCRVVGLVKGEPVLTDVTRKDAERVGLDLLVDKMVDTGQFAIGVDLESASPDCLEAFRGADVVIAKGMANFEALSDEDVGEVFYLMRAKCEPVAKAAGVAKDQNVAVYRPSGSRTG